MMGLSDSTKISMMRSAVLTQITRVSDGIGVAYTHYSIYAVARKKRGMKSMHIFIKVGGRLRGESLFLLTHVFALYSLPIIFTAQCTLVHMRGLEIACRPSVCNVGGL